jgi:hypothetical protein
VFPAKAPRKNKEEMRRKGIVVKNLKIPFFLCVLCPFAGNSLYHE